MVFGSVSSSLKKNLNTLFYIVFGKMLQAIDIRNQGYYDETSPLQRSSTRYEASDCLFAEHTDYAFTVIIKNPDYGTMLFLDGELQSSSYDEAIYHETLVHPIMRSLNHIDDKNVLVVGGAEGATVREVLKWGRNKVRRVDWVDIDTRLVDLCKVYLRYAADSTVYTDSSVHFFGQDIMQYLMNCQRKYHCIIIDLPDPDPGEQILYGPEFWRLIRGAMKANGRIVTHTGPVEPGPGRQQGLDIIRNGAGRGYPYHTFVPSFQSEWGFWMSKRPVLEHLFPDSCKVMTNHYQSTVFHWDRHWAV